MVTCSVVKQAYPHTPSCCHSCHEDADYYGYWLCGDDENFSVCCAVGRFLEDTLLIDTYEKVTDQRLLNVLEIEREG